MSAINCTGDKKKPFFSSSIQHCKAACNAHLPSAVHAWGTPYGAPHGLPSGWYKNKSALLEDQVKQR